MEQIPIRSGFWDHVFGKNFILIAEMCGVDMAVATNAIDWTVNADTEE